ncbi:NRDE family protein [Planococcus sp. YIM B11945]|uniref:NRDE family protein n=1 Tax=Planococcus sp. YIM B11945 TaxID=3435410 RepID=UPI003D7D01A2
MCLINFQLNEHPKYKLIVAANRDEFYNRPSQPAHFWEDEPVVLAGRDLLQGGTWLGITKTGRFAALTNYRDPSKPEAGKISRGAIVKDFLVGSEHAETFLNTLEPADYTGFNVLAGTADQLFYYNNLQGAAVEVPAGTHGLSNHFLNTPWPKVVKGKKLLSEYTALHENLHLDTIFAILANAEQATDAVLPKTGIGLEFERKLSAMFIKTPEYGTRSASIVLIDYENNVTFAERTYENGEFHAQQVFEFAIE